MKSSYLINLGLIILLVGLYWFNNHSNTPSSTDTKLTLIDSETVEHIIISQGNRAEIILDKTVGQWQLTAPLTAHANPTRINLLLSLLTINTGRQQAITKGQDLSPFGLTKDSVSLTLGQQHFLFGNIEPISQHRYVLHNDTLYLLEDTISPLLNTNASSFIDNRLIPEGQNLTQITIPFYQQQTLSNQTITLSLIDGDWQTEQHLTADQQVELVDNWHHARALQVIPLDAIASEFEPSTFYANLTFDDRTEPMKLALHLNEASFFIINEKAKLAYQFPKVLYQTLLLPIPNL